MKKTITAKIEELIDDIKKSPVYMEYAIALNELGKDEQAMRKLRDFKRAETQYWQLGRRSMNLEDEKMLSYGYSELTLNERASSFLEKERRLCELLTQIYSALETVSPITFDD
jgi:cell fate (sporulation/competence/biofilm development) regulator YlbF (YheA/YmcA/DUF963 family)